ncbi:MAG: hypothetical protein RR696_15435, partial [Clostridia bacterium]
SNPFQAVGLLSSNHPTPRKSAAKQEFCIQIPYSINGSFHLHNKEDKNQKGGICRDHPRTH